MTNGLFITGTDTDAGKTIVTAGLLRALRRRDIDAVSMKPVQTGAELIDGRSASPDLRVHHAAAEFTPAPDELKWMAPYLYEPACSPHLAGRMAGRYAQINVIRKCFEKLSSRHAMVLVEGAGGVLAPVNDRETMLDLMLTLDLPVVVVARRGLGTINHTLLSVEAIGDVGLTVLGVVFNETENVPMDFIREDNPRAVAQFGDVAVLGNVDYMPSFDDAGWAQFDSECADLITAVCRLLRA